jgi:hypothetical protein
MLHERCGAWMGAWPRAQASMRGRSMRVDCVDNDFLGPTYPPPPRGKYRASLSAPPPHPCLHQASLLPRSLISISRFSLFSDSLQQARFELSLSPLRRSRPQRAEAAVDGIAAVNAGEVHGRPAALASGQGADSHRGGGQMRWCCKRRRRLLEAATRVASSCSGGTASVTVSTVVTHAATICGGDCYNLRRRLLQPAPAAATTVSGGCYYWRQRC